MDSSKSGSKEDTESQPPSTPGTAKTLVATNQVESNLDQDSDISDTSTQDEENSFKTIAESESHPAADVSPNKLALQESSEMSAAPDIDKQDTSTQDEENSFKTTAESESHPTADVSPNKLTLQESSEMSERSAPSEIDKQDASKQEGENKLTQQEVPEQDPTAQSQGSEKKKSPSMTDDFTKAAEKQEPSETEKLQTEENENLSEQGSPCGEEKASSGTSQQQTSLTTVADTESEKTEGKSDKSKEANVAIPLFRVHSSVSDSSALRILKNMAENINAEEGTKEMAIVKEVPIPTGTFKADMPTTSMAMSLVVSGKAKTSDIAQVTKVGTTGAASQVTTVGKAKIMQSILKQTGQGGKAAPMRYIQVGGKLYSLNNQGATLGTTPSVAKVTIKKAQTEASVVKASKEGVDTAQSVGTAPQVAPVQTPGTGQQVATAEETQTATSISKPAKVTIMKEQTEASVVKTSRQGIAKVQSLGTAPEAFGQGVVITTDKHNKICAMAQSLGKVTIKKLQTEASVVKASREGVDAAQSLGTAPKVSSVQTPGTGQQAASAETAQTVTSIVKATAQEGKTAAPLTYVRIGGNLYPYNNQVKQGATKAEVMSAVKVSGKGVDAAQSLGAAPQVASVQTPGTGQQVARAEKAQTVTSIAKPTGQEEKAAPLSYVRIGGKLYRMKKSATKAPTETSGVKPTGQEGKTAAPLSYVRIGRQLYQVNNGTKVGTAPGVAKAQTVTRVAKASEQGRTATSFTMLGGKLCPVISLLEKKTSTPGTSSAPVQGKASAKTATVGKPGSVAEASTRGATDGAVKEGIVVTHTTKEGEAHVREIVKKQIAGSVEHFVSRTLSVGEKDDDDESSSSDEEMETANRDHGHSQKDLTGSGRKKEKAKRSLDKSSDEEMAPTDHDHGLYSQRDLHIAATEKKIQKGNLRMDKWGKIDKCMVKGCNSNRRSTPHLRLFRWPWKDEARFEIWAENARRPEFIADRARGKKDFGRVCELHFECIYLGRRMLIRDAVPTLLLDGSGTDNEPKRKNTRKRQEEENTLDQLDENEKRFLIGSELKVKPGALSTLTKKEENTKPVFLSPLKDYTERGFKHVLLKCHINLDVADVIWYQNGEEIVPCKHFRVKFDVKPARVKKSMDCLFKIGVISLTIMKPTAEDSGLYMCKVTGNNGKYAVSCEYVAVHVLDHQDADNAINYDEYPYIAPAVECRKCKLEIYPVDTGSTLVDDMLPLMKSDLANDASKSTLVSSSDLPKAPKCVMKLKNTTTKLGKTVTLRCMFDDTEAKTWWYRNGKRLAVCKHYDTLVSTTQMGSFYALLRVMNVMEEDFGVYTCVVIGKSKRAASTSCIVSCKEEDDVSDINDNIVKEVPVKKDECKKCTRGIQPPDAPLVHDEAFHRLQKEVVEIHTSELPIRRKSNPPKFLKELSNATLKYGDKLVLTAMINDPYASISWYHNGAILGTCKHTEMVLSTSSKRRYAVLRINPAIDSDAGTYTCMATGKFINTNKTAISECTVAVQGGQAYTGFIEAYSKLDCLKCVEDPSHKSSQEVMYTPAAKTAREESQRPPAERLEELKTRFTSQEQTFPTMATKALADFATMARKCRKRPAAEMDVMPTIQSAWSVSTAAPAEFSTPERESRKRPAEETDVEIPPPPPDTPPRSPSPPLPTHDSDVAPCFVQKLVDQRYSPVAANRKYASVMLICAVNVQSAKHEWFHNGKKILPCKDNNITRAVDQKNINQMIAMMEINNLDGSDNGVYTCVASNDKGSVSTSCFLLGSTNQAKTMANWPVLECEKCKVDRKKGRIPKLHKEQKIVKQEPMDSKDEENMPSTSGQSQAANPSGKDQALSENSSGKDKNPTESSDGTGASATVEGSQPENPTEQQAYIEMIIQNTQPRHMPLIVTRELIGVKDRRSWTITLKCRFSHLVPTIKWFYMGYQIQECSHYQQVTELVDGEARVSLRLSKLRTVDLGVYTCVAYTAKDPFVSTSCNLTAKGGMNEYLKYCKKCITRKVARLNAYETLVKKRRRVAMELEEEDEDEVKKRKKEEVTAHPLRAVAIGDRMHINWLDYKSPRITMLPPTPATCDSPLNKETGAEVSKKSQDAQTANTPTGKAGLRPWYKRKEKTSVKSKDKTSVKSKGKTSVKKQLADTLIENQHIVDRKKCEQLLHSTNANLRKKVKNYLQILRRQTQVHDKQLRGLVPNKYKVQRGVQTINDGASFADQKRFEKQHAKLMSATSRYGVAVKEIAKLQDNMKSQQEKHEEAMTQMKDKVAELEAKLQRRDGSSIGRQLQSRGKDPSAYAGFIQYMTDDSNQQF